MRIEQPRVGFAFCGSFCTMARAMEALEAVAAQYGQVVPIVSETVAATDTRFGNAHDFMREMERICDRRVIATVKDAEPIGPKKLLDVLLVGIAQAIATCPGISRSVTTITAGCFVGFDRKFAVRFSFLLSIPAVLGANILTLKDAIQENSIIVSDIPVYLVGVAVAAVVGYICIRLLKMIADKGKFGWFAYYCWAVGLIVLALTLVLK